MRAVSLPPRPRLAALGVLLLALCLPGWWLARCAFAAAWLAAWLYCAGIVLGGLAHVWVHNLTHGAWGEPIRGSLLELGRLLPWLALLFLPVLAATPDLYPWAGKAELGAGRWAGELSAPAFKSAWLQPAAFALRAVAVLLVWNLLAWASRRPAFARSGPFAAVALILYGLSMSVAAVDWVMSLMPAWYSSIFGLEVAMGQVLAGMALAAVLACREPAAGQGVRRDLGNLLLAYVMVWAYFAFADFLVIWSENLPHEIAWYVARRREPWLGLGLLLVLGQFLLPFLLLLFRAVKDAPRRLGGVASGLLVTHLLEQWWLILPSVADRVEGRSLAVLLPLASFGFLALCFGLAPAHVWEFRHG